MLPASHRMGASSPSGVGPAMVGMSCGSSAPMGRASGVSRPSIRARPWSATPRRAACLCSQAGFPTAVPCGFGSRPTWWAQAVGGVYESLWLVDADGGEPRRALPAGEVWNVAFAPDGRQLAALTARELRLVDTGDGQLTRTVPMDTYSTYRGALLYSHDGRYVLVYVSNGLALVDASTGQRRDIPLAYTPLGASDHAYYPSMQWLEGDGSALTVVYDVGSWLDRLQPAATFSVWRLDLSQGTASRVQTFTGGAWGVDLSPDGRWVAYTNYDHTTLSLADLQTGHSVVYDRQEVLISFGWHLDSIHFVYRGENLSPLLGETCGPPTPLVQPGYQSWIGASFYPIQGRDEFLTVSGAPTGGSHVIHLNTLDGQSRIVATLVKPDYPTTYVGYFLGD